MARRTQTTCPMWAAIPGLVEQVGSVWIFLSFPSFLSLSDGHSNPELAQVLAALLSLSYSQWSLPPSLHDIETCRKPGLGTPQTLPHFDLKLCPPPHRDFFKGEEHYLPHKVRWKIKLVMNLEHGAEWLG